MGGEQHGKEESTNIKSRALITPYPGTYTSATTVPKEGTDMILFVQYPRTSTTSHATKNARRQAMYYTIYRAGRPGMPHRHIPRIIQTQRNQGSIRYTSSMKFVPSCLFTPRSSQVVQMHPLPSPQKPPGAAAWVSPSVHSPCNAAQCHFLPSRHVPGAWPSSSCWATA